MTSHFLRILALVAILAVQQRCNGFECLPYEKSELDHKDPPYLHKKYTIQEKEPISHWAVTADASHYQCVLVNVTASIVIPRAILKRRPGYEPETELYNKTSSHDSSSTKTSCKTNFSNITLEIPKEANFTGRCEVNQQSLRIFWKNTNKSLIVEKVRLEMVFKKRNLEESEMEENSPNLPVVYLSDITIWLGFFDSAYESLSLVLPSVNLFKTPQDMSYYCPIRQIVEMAPVFTGEQLNSTSHPFPALLILDNLALEAFRLKHEIGLRARLDCTYRWYFDVVPIAVSAALAVLVVSVFVAYLCKRKISRKTTYSQYKDLSEPNC